MVCGPRNVSPVWRGVALCGGMWLCVTWAPERVGERLKCPDKGSRLLSGWRLPLRGLQRPTTSFCYVPAPLPSDAPSTRAHVRPRSAPPRPCPPLENCLLVSRPVAAARSHTQVGPGPGPGPGPRPAGLV